MRCIFWASCMSHVLCPTILFKGILGLKRGILCCLIVTVYSFITYLMLKSANPLALQFDIGCTLSEFASMVNLYIKMKLGEVMSVGKPTTRSFFQQILFRI